VAIDFGVTRARGAVLVLRLDDGGTVPPGATVRVAGEADEFITAPGGEVYLTGLERENEALATWSGGQCAIAFRFPDDKDPQPHLGEIPCRSVLR
jgi:outer membrane usher protein